MISTKVTILACGSLNFFWCPQDQRLFVSGSRDGFIKIWDAEGVAWAVGQGVVLKNPLANIQKTMENHQF